MNTFTRTIDIVPRLSARLAIDGASFESSAGNSTGHRRVCHELLGESITILGWADRAEMMAYNGLSVTFAEFDLQDRLFKFPVNPGRAVKFDDAGVLKPYLREDGTLRYTYSERMYYQLEPIVNLLKEHPETRQAFMSIWDPTLDIEALEKDRVPCSIGFHFILREGRLNLLYSMRSLEVTRCLGNDIYTSTRLLEEVAARVGVRTGYVKFMVGSMHIFD